MLAGFYAYLALIALVAAAVLSAGLAMTRMTIARATVPYLAAEYQRAETALQQRVADDMQLGGVPFPAPAFTPLPSTCANDSCTYTSSATITITQTAAATPGPACDPSQTNCAPNVQTNAAVSEGRVMAKIVVTLRGLRGETVASRSGSVILRTMNAPPYVALAGSRNDSFDGEIAANAAGDDGGSAPATPDPCASSAPGSADDTTVRVAYRNRVTNACANGSSWGTASYGGTAASSGWTP